MKCGSREGGKTGKVREEELAKSGGVCACGRVFVFACPSDCLSTCLSVCLSVLPRPIDLVKV